MLAPGPDLKLPCIKRHVAGFSPEPSLFKPARQSVDGMYRFMIVGVSREEGLSNHR